MMEFKWDITYFISNVIVAADGSSQRIDETFMAKM